MFFVVEEKGCKGERGATCLRVHLLSYVFPVVTGACRGQFGTAAYFWGAAVHLFSFLSSLLPAFRSSDRLRLFHQPLVGPLPILFLESGANDFAARLVVGIDPLDLEVKGKMAKINKSFLTTTACHYLIVRQ